MKTCQRCGVELRDGETNRSADSGPVTVAGWYACEGGHAWHWWSNGRVRNNPPICSLCLTAHLDAEARALGYKDSAERMERCFGI